MSRPRVLAVAVSGPGEAAAAMLSPHGRRVRVAALPFVRANWRRHYLDAQALAELIDGWKPDAVATWADPCDMPARGLVGFARSIGISEGVVAAAGLPVLRVRDGSFRFSPDAEAARRAAVARWPEARAEFEAGSRALADAAFLAEEVRDPMGYDQPRRRAARPVVLQPGRAA